MSTALTPEEDQRWRDQQAQIDSLSRDLAARQVLQNRDEQIRAMQAQLEPPPRNLGEALLHSTRALAAAAAAEKAKQPPQPGIDWNKKPALNDIMVANRVRAALEG